MREILFRGKDIDTNEWRYGAYYNGVHGGGLSKIYEPHESLIIDEHTEVFHRVLSETVGQFTGIDDMNGNKIFEGDIVRISSRPDLTNNQIKRGFLHHKKKGLVTFDKGRWVAKRQLNEGSYYNIGLYDDDYEFAIIGNIHNNAELLEEELK